MKLTLACLLAFFLCTPFALSAEKEDLTAKEALQSLNHLVGEWKGTGEPEGTRAEKRRGFWIEKLHWEWKFEKEQAWLQMKLEKSKHYLQGDMRYLPGMKKYQLTLTTLDKKKVVYEGDFDGKKLELERQDPESKDFQRIVFTFLHSNRYLYRYETREADRTRYRKEFQVGATKQGVPFASTGDSSPECIVSGGKGTIAVSYQGKTWYVCCSGCAAEFKDNPVKYIKEYEAKKAKEKK